MRARQLALAALAIGAVACGGGASVDGGAPDSGIEAATPDASGVDAGCTHTLCVDTVLCTIDTCVDGVCVHTPQPTACPAGESCDVARDCQCPSGTTECRDPRTLVAACFDLATSAANCGACGRACPGTSCAGSHCACPAGQMDCSPDGRCVDTTSNPADCGGCGSVCHGTCSSGHCTVCGAAGQPCCASGPACTERHTSCGASSVCEVDACALTPPTLTAPEVPRCAAETLDCAIHCASYVCADGCTSADTTPPAPDGLDCAGCVSHATDICASRGCPVEWADFACCKAAHCASSTDPMCPRTSCLAELTSLNTCVVSLSGPAAACYFIDSGEPRACFP